MAGLLALRWLHSVIPTTVESTPSSSLVHGWQPPPACFWSRRSPDPARQIRLWHLGILRWEMPLDDCHVHWYAIGNHGLNMVKLWSLNKVVPQLFLWISHSSISNTETASCLLYHFRVLGVKGNVLWPIVSRMLSSRKEWMVTKLVSGIMGMLQAWSSNVPIELVMFQYLSMCHIQPY